MMARFTKFRCGLDKGSGENRRAPTATPYGGAVVRSARPCSSGIRSRQLLATLSTVAAVLALSLPPVPAHAGRAKPVHFTAVVAPAVAKSGDSVTVTIQVAIDSGYHVYSVVPVPPPGPEATVVTVTGGGLTPTGPATESAPTTENDPNFGKTVRFHTTRATFTQALKVGSAAATTVPLTISVRYQACNDRFCLPPATVSVDAAPLTVTGGAAPVLAAAPVAGSGALGVSPPGGRTAIVRTGETDSGLAGIAWAGFLAGLLALITPCVFPLIPVTFAYFTKQAQAGHGSLVKLATAYAIGIVLSFTTIGAVFAAVFGAAGANRFAANPFVNVVFAVLFIVFGLAMLEMVELRPPAFLQRLRGGGVSTPAVGVLGVLGMGLTFVVAAFTCTAPFIGTILVAASTASTGSQWLPPLVGMLSFALAIALPFFLLALFPAWLVRLPRSGAWLSTIKGAMGFIELAAALKFLSNVDLVLQLHLLTQPVLLGLWMLLAVAGAAYLWGALRIGLGAPEGRVTVGRALGASAFLAAAAVCLWGLSGHPLPADMAAFLPPSDYGASTTTNAGRNPTGQDALADGELPYLYDLDAGLAQARAENKPIFVDFTGYTCTNCRWMEKNIFTTARVKTELAKFVRVRLYTDGGPDADKKQAYEEKTFGTVALPLYAVLGPDGKPRATSVGITRDPEKFAAFLEAGAGGGAAP